MKDPFLSRRKRPNNHAKKLKLICSFNGTFQPRPPSGELRYTGGETRIVTADRNITLSRLKSKVSELLSNNALLSFSLRYRLTGEEDDDNAPLVLIASDDDVRCMTDEYEELESLGKTTRLWIFVCNNENMMNLNCGYGVSGKISHGFGGDCVNSVCDAVNGFESRNSKTHLCGGEIDRVKNCSTVGGVRCSDGSLRELVLKQQVLAKQSYGLDVEQINIEFTSDNQKHDQYDHSLEDHETTCLKFDGNPYREKDYEFRNTQLQRIEKLDPRDGNSFVGPNSFMQCLINREKVTPWSTDFDLVKAPFRPHCCSNQTKLSNGGDRVWVGIRSGIRNHRNCLYHIRNHRNSIIEMGNHRNGRLEGRPWVGKFYPRLRSSSNISKQGQAIRSHYPNFWKPWSGYHDGTPEGLARMMNSGLSITYLFDRGVPQPQPPNPTAYNCAYTSMSDQSLLTSIVTKNPLISTRAMDAPEDLLTGSISEKHEVACQAPCKNLLRVPMSSQPSRNLKRESQLLEPMQAIDTSGYPNSLDVKNRTKSGCNGKLSNIESSVRLLSNHRGSAHAIQGGLASSVDISLCNLSLSSSKEVEPPAHFSPACNGVSKALLKPQSKPLYLMDEEHSSGPQVEASNGVVSDSSSQNTITLEKDDEQEKEMQQDHASRLSNDKKADIKESRKCSKANGSIPSDLAVFYSHLATRDLQTIKNSDLEYIKELGSGTYGTVFYGKWKGCDVAVKKLKRSCFTEGAPDQDRLVADFWKEAHILGQLHHPHIVAFYGVVRDGPVTNLATVTEYMVNGSLKQVLQRKDRTIDRRKRLIIAMDAAFGMEYLHEKNIVHFDLKSHNFLVNMRDPQRPVCKIGDLGLSKIKQRTLVSGGVRGTIPWMAPELLNSKENMVTEKVDVYSFGIVMWELLTGEEPYGNMRSEEIIAGIIIKGNLRPEIPSWCDPAWRSLMERCWSSDPECRPSFSEIAKELRAMSASMNIK